MPPLVGRPIARRAELVAALHIHARAAAAVFFARPIADRRLVNDGKAFPGVFRRSKRERETAVCGGISRAKPEGKFQISFKDGVERARIGRAVPFDEQAAERHAFGFGDGRTGILRRNEQKRLNFRRFTIRFLFVCPAFAPCTKQDPRAYKRKCSRSFPHHHILFVRIRPLGPDCIFRNVQIL